MKRLLSLWPVLVVAIAVAATATCTPFGGSTHVSGGAATPLPQPTGTPSIPQGIPAIKPTQTGVPAYTLNDARAYVSTHSLPGALNRDTKFTIAQSAFLQSAEVSRLLNGESTGYPDNAVLCYFLLQGSFVFTGPRGTTITFPFGVEVFDATTGNLVIAGGEPASVSATPAPSTPTPGIG